jgi:hypothetical protein
MSVWSGNIEKSVLGEEYRRKIKMLAFFPAATVEAKFAKLSKLMAYVAPGVLGGDQPPNLAPHIPA